MRVPKIDEDVIKKVLDMGFDAIAARIYRFDEVTAVYLMSGAYDLMLEVQAESLRTLANFVSQKLATIDSVLSTMTVDDFNAMMDEAISIQPLSE